MTLLLTQGPVYIERIIEICCSQIPASNSASGATQFSHQRPYCPPTGSTGPRPDSRNPEAPSSPPPSMKLVPGPRPMRPFHTWTHCLPTLRRQKTGGGCPFPCSPPPGEPSGQDRERSSKEEGHLLGRSAAAPASPGLGHTAHRAEVQDTQGLAPLGKPSTNSPGPKPSMCRGRDVGILGLDTPQLTTTGHHSGGGSLCDTRPPRQK